YVPTRRAARDRLQLLAWGRTRRDRVGSSSMRRRLPWLIVMPLMVAGSLGAHTLSGLLAATPGEGILAADRDGGSDRAGVGVAAHSVLPVGVLVALVVATAVTWLLGRAGGRGRGASPWVFLVLPPLAFTSQEL